MQVLTLFYFTIGEEIVLFAPYLDWHLYMTHRLLSTLILAAFTACSNVKTEKTNGYKFSKGEPLAELREKRLEEVSGLAASITNKGLLWTHNDSFNAAQIFLIDEDLDIKLTCELAGIENRDWEDITVGPGPEAGKNYIYLGEIGDNLAQYPYKVIYRFEEPVLAGNTERIVINKFDKIFFKLPDGKKDTEALSINPQSKNLYVISKREEPVHVYELKYPQSTSDTTIATDLMTLPFKQIVAADFSADGKELLMKSYKKIYYFPIETSKPIAESLKAQAKELPYDEEPQGESITFARDGSGFYTISEKNEGKKSYLLFYKRQ
jgi:hypothetical protein